MAWWQRWVRQPQSIWLRKASFQIHLWTGLLAGLYIVVLSVTGSVMVYRAELVRFFATPRPAFDATARRRSVEELRASAQRAYPGYQVSDISDSVTRRNPTIQIRLERDGWAVMGLVPALLFTTGLVMRWSRVVRKTRRKEAQ